MATRRVVGPLRRPGRVRAGRHGGAGERRDPLRNTRGSTLALAKRSRAAKVTLRRTAKVKGKLVAWACPAAISAGATPPPCSGKVALHSTATLNLPAAMAGKVRVVVVRARP